MKMTNLPYLPFKSASTTQIIPKFGIPGLDSDDSYIRRDQDLEPNKKGIVSVLGDFFFPEFTVSDDLGKKRDREREEEVPIVGAIASHSSW